MHRVRSLFGRFDRTGAVALPATVEPRQNGERRINLVTASEQQYFEVAYHAPAVHDDDFVAFLVLREIIGGSTGLNFQHDSGFSSVREGAYLDPGMTTWFHPTRQPFLFTISAEVPAGNSQAEFEKSVEQNLVRLREEPVSPATLEHARRQLLRELVFDVETTEDAAHQLGYFAGLDALNVLLELPQAVAAINIADIQRVARRFLVPSQRTTGWLMPSAEARKVLAANPARELASPVNHQGTPTGNEPVKRATAGVSFLSEGMPVIVKQHTLSDSAYLSVVYPAAGVGLDGHVAAAGLVSGHTIQEFQVLPGELDDAIKHARKSLGQAGFEDAKPRVASNDPGLRLSQAIDQASAFEAVRPEVPPAPALIVAVGNFDPGMVLGRLESAFGDIAPAAAPGRASPVQRAGDLDVKTVLPRSQGQIGYVIPAPAPGSNDYDAWRIALYIFSHDYEGRLGRKVISQAGLLYWIDSGYETDGQHGRIVIRAGVDPSRMASVKRLFHAELARLESDPPTELEIAEARNHFLGRRQSAAQSNTEIAHRLMRDWLARGEIVSMESLRTRLDAVGREDVIRILPAFCAGSVITVNVEGISSWPAK
jgi:predicted Zn-dependent peptidase